MWLRLVIVTAVMGGLAACDGQNAVVFTTTTDAPTSTTTATAPTSTTTAMVAPATVTPAPAQPTTSPPGFTAADVAAALRDPASAYVASRGGPSEAAALSAAAGTLLASPRASDLDAVPTAGVLSLRALLEFLADSPGFGWIKALEQEGALTGLPVFLLDGTYAVRRDIQPGRYEAPAVTGCYWETLDAAGGKNAEDFVPAGGRAEATIHTSDVTFNSDGCSTWFLIGG